MELCMETHFSEFLEWNVNNLVWLRVLRWDEPAETMLVDFGAYFDFPLDGADDYPNYPENMDEVLGPEEGVPPHFDRRNFRYRVFRTKEVHYLYNLTVLPKDELLADLRFLLDDWVRWDRNQFVFWASHAKKAERCYLDPVRRMMLRKTLADGPNSHDTPRIS